MSEDKPKKVRKPRAPKVAKPEPTFVESMLATVKPLPPTTEGKDYFKTMFSDEFHCHKVLPIDGMGCVLSVDGKMLYIPGARFVDGKLVK